MKALLLDADGVVLKRHRYFSERFAEEYNVPQDLIVPFFKDEFRKCQTGKADLKEALVPYLEKWGWQGSVEDFMQYWFDSDTEIDAEVFSLVKGFRAKGIPCYLVTDQEQYRAEFIRKKLDGMLDGFFFSSELGASKDTPEFFVSLLKTLNVAPGEVTYLDDDQKNVDVALTLGIDAYFYNGIEDLERLIY